MLFSHSWLSHAGSGLGRAIRDRRRAPGKRKTSPQRLCLEQLEERDMPSSVTPNLYIGDAKDNSVEMFDAATGAFQGTFVKSGSGGLAGPRGVIFDHTGNLLVSNQNVNLPINGDILRFDGGSGTLDNQAVSPSDPNGPFAPRGIVLGPDDTLYVADIVAPDNLSDGKIEEYQYNEKTGTAVFKGEIDHPTNLAGQFHPRGLVFGPDGMLYVSIRNIPDQTGGAVLRFNPISGAFLGVFAASDAVNDLQRPEGLTFGPDGNLYVTSFRKDTSDTDKILEFNGNTGAYSGKIDLDSVGGNRAFAQALLFGPNGKLFVPITGDDSHTTGQVRRYDVATKTYDVFISSAHLGNPWYLTFNTTDPATLAYGENSDLGSPGLASAATTMAPNALMVDILSPPASEQKSLTLQASNSGITPRSSQAIVPLIPESVPSNPRLSGQDSVHQAVFISLEHASPGDPLGDAWLEMSTL